MKQVKQEERKLASVQYVHHITPIEGADRIECVHVLGWQCVANKGQFQVGDHCVYFEVDSFLPVCDSFEFLRNSSFKKSEILGEGFRLKTLKFRGQISQGLVQPLSILPEGKYELGSDVTEILGVRKWEIEEKVTSSGTVIGDFPYGITKTDELRVQSYPNLISEFKAVPSYYISTKMDGTSVTMYWKDGEFGVCGRNYEYEDNDKCAMWKYAHELCKKLGLKMVPIEEQGEAFPYNSVEELLERAKGKYDSGMNKEGIVIRPVDPVYSKTIEGPLSMKVLNNDYLLKD